MDFFDRRAFLRGSTAAALGLAAPPDLFTSTASAQPSWDAGVVQHLLPAGQRPTHPDQGLVP
jgi:hypothetical protein